MKVGDKIKVTNYIFDNRIQNKVGTIKKAYGHAGCRGGLLFEVEILGFPLWNFEEQEMTLISKINHVCPLICECNAKEAITF